MPELAPSSSAQVRAITAADAAQVSAFLHAHLNPRVPPARWEALIHPPWGETGPNHGFQLVDGHGTVHGVYLAVYSPRREGAQQMCNLAAFCVEEEYRGHSLRLVRALLRQREFLFTDLSPSGNVPGLNTRLGFVHLDVETRLVINPPLSRGSDHLITAKLHEIEALLDSDDLSIFRDHRYAPAARHLLVSDGSAYAYLIYRRVRRKRLPLFAAPIHVGGDWQVLANAWPQVSAHLFRQGLPLTLAERRVLGFAPSGVGRTLARPRPKMYRGELPPGQAVSYLYSELVLLEW